MKIPERRWIKHEPVSKAPMKTTEIKFLYLGVEARNAFEVRVLEIDEKSALLEIRIGDDPPSNIRMTTDDVFYGHFTAKL
jgi:hypothetical protein